MLRFEGKSPFFVANRMLLHVFGLSRALWTFGRRSLGRLTVPSAEGCLGWLDRSGYAGA